MTRADLINMWLERRTNLTKGRWTHPLIPDIRIWTNRPYGEIDYFLTQTLTGHFCNMKLHGKNRAESEGCSYCRNTDDAEQTLFVCSRWEHNNISGGSICLLQTEASAENHYAGSACRKNLTKRIWAYQNNNQDKGERNRKPCRNGAKRLGS